MIPPWNLSLTHRRGSPQRLLGIDLYHDFEWLDLFPDGRAQFKNGRCLARLALDDCPQGKLPGLLLTTQGEAEEGPIESDTHFLVVVNLPRYLEQRNADAAASYYAHRMGSGITSIARLREVARHPEVVSTVMAEQLDLQRIALWASEESGRLEQLRTIAGVSGSDIGAADLSSALRALSALETLDQKSLQP